MKCNVLVSNATLSLDFLLLGNGGSSWWKKVWDVESRTILSMLQLLQVLMHLLFMCQHFVENRDLNIKFSIFLTVYKREKLHIIVMSSSVNNNKRKTNVIIYYCLLHNEKDA